MMALPSAFPGFLLERDLASRNNDCRGCGDDWRAVIGEGTDAGEAIGQTSHGRSGQHEGEGEDKAQGPHVRLSPVVAADVARRCSCGLDNQAAFPDVCAKSGKWFRRTAELFRRLCPTTQLKNVNNFKLIGCRPREIAWFIGRAAVVHWPSPAVISHAGAGILKIRCPQAVGGPKPSPTF
jgi:hypothetical protein